MIEENEILEALKELYRRKKTQKALAELAGITQSTINAYLSGKAKIENMPVGVFLKLFRNMTIDFWGSYSSDEDPILNELLEIFYSLEPRDRARCLALLAAHFGDKLRAEPQPVKKVAGSQILKEA